MVVTLLGIVTVLKPLHPLNAPLPMVFTPDGTTKSFTSEPFRYRCWANPNGFDGYASVPLSLTPHHAARSVMWTAFRLLQYSYLQLIVYQLGMIKMVEK